MMSKAHYEKKDNYYVIYFDKINFAIPISFNGLRISDKMIEGLISKYENGSLDFHYKDEKLFITEDEIVMLVGAQNNALLNVEVKK